MKSFINLSMVLMLAFLAVIGCTNNSRTEEPHLEKIHALMQQGKQVGYPETCRYLLKLDQQTQTR